MFVLVTLSCLLMVRCKFINCVFCSLLIYKLLYFGGIKIEFLGFLSSIMPVIYIVLMVIYVGCY